MATNEVFTVGYPRSGNKWLSRILSDSLCAPIQPKPGAPDDTRFAQNIRDEYVVRMTHLPLKRWLEIEETGYLGNKPKLVMIVRDPRDVAVSIMYYREIQNLGETIARMITDGYPSFMDSWLDYDSYLAIRYEDIIEYPIDATIALFDYVTETTMDYGFGEMVAQRQSFDNWLHLDRKTHRKGIIGDWKNHFTRQHAEVFDKELGVYLRILGYEKDSSWVNKRPSSNG